MEVHVDYRLETREAGPLDTTALERFVLMWASVLSSGGLLSCQPACQTDMDMRLPRTFVDKRTYVFGRETSFIVFTLSLAWFTSICLAQNHRPRLHYWFVNHCYCMTGLRGERNRMTGTPLAIDQPRKTCQRASPRESAVLNRFDGELCSFDKRDKVGGEKPRNWIQERKMTLVRVK